MELIEHLKAGPKTASELLKLSSLSRRTLYKRMNYYVKKGDVVILPMKMKDQWVSLFALKEHEEVAMEISGYMPYRRTLGIEKKIVDALSMLRAKLLRNPTPEEIAVAIREDPEDGEVRRAIYRTASKAGWRPPTKEEKRRAEREKTARKYLKRVGLK
jgi:hypothetical protein